MRKSPGSDLTLDQRLLRGTLKEREEEARRQGVFECWETRARRDQEEGGLLIPPTPSAK